MSRASPIVREALLAATAAASLAALLAWIVPPSGDLAAHMYQRAVFLEDGFELWSNFWYGGRYSFVTYSVLYYPLAAVFGIEPLAVASIATAALAFAVVVGRQWGPLAKWSSRTFAVVWAGLMFSAAFPFALGIALGLLAVWALQGGSRWRFALLALLTLLASPLAFLLVVVVLAGIALGVREEPRRLVAPALIVLAVGGLYVLAWRAFPGSARFPFPIHEFVAALAFCILGAALTWRVDRARVLRWLFVAYLPVVLAAYVIPSALGGNVARLRFAAIPIGVLLLSLRGWRPRWVVVGALTLAAAWNLTPFAFSYSRAQSSSDADPAYWQPAIDFLNENLTPSYRVEAVDTANHWPAVHLPRAGIPLARGWYRQDDFPQNELLYEELRGNAYRAWLRRLGVRYVVLSDARPDWSAIHEAALLESGRSGLRPVFRSSDLTVFAVPRPRPIVTGPGEAEVIDVGQGHVLVRLERAGRYRIAVRHAPYWRSDAGCVTSGADGMLRLDAWRSGLVRLEFRVEASRALAAVVGSRRRLC
jgi:hypothetical protein